MDLSLNVGIYDDFFTPSYLIPHKNDLNSLNFRSDKFTNNHNGKHVVFSGCSYTYGIGLELNEIWAYKVYQKISEKEQCSGFFNLGVYGHGTIHIVSNLFKYFKKYGNPDVIFINLPDLPRFTLSKNNQYIISRLEKDNIINTVYYFSYEYYFMLEEYCKANNIKLLSFSWDIEDSKNFLIKRNKYFKSSNSFFSEHKFNTFYKIEEDVFYKDIENILSYDHNKFNITARDGSHPGTSFHIAYSNFIYNKYLKV